MTTVSTRILILSDTHGSNILPAEYGDLDLVIHCGDLTEGSTLSEFGAALEILKQIPAPMKLIIAGNHDFTLDDSAYRAILTTSKLSFDDPEDMVKLSKEYGAFGDALALLRGAAAANSGINYLDEGTHDLTLQNGASLKVYASPFTPFQAEQDSGMGFQYHPNSGHAWQIPTNVDIVMTHGPPRGIFDYTESKQRAGDPDLFSAVARAKPLLHCFGHIHPGWGARKVLWRKDIGQSPSHFTAVDNDGSRTIESTVSIRQRGDHGAWQRYRGTGYYAIDMAESPKLNDRRETMFVNAAIQGPDEESPQVPWLIELDLPRAAK